MLPGSARYVVSRILCRTALTLRQQISILLCHHARPVVSSHRSPCSSKLRLHPCRAGRLDRYHLLRLQIAAPLCQAVPFEIASRARLLLFRMHLEYVHDAHSTTMLHLATVRYVAPLCKGAESQHRPLLHPNLNDQNRQDPPYLARSSAMIRLRPSNSHSEAVVRKFSSTD